jgi:hypothetical protein
MGRRSGGQVADRIVTVCRRHTIDTLTRPNAVRGVDVARLGGRAAANDRRSGKTTPRIVPVRRRIAVVAPLICQRPVVVIIELRLARLHQASGSLYHPHRNPHGTICGYASRQ